MQKTIYVKEDDLLERAVELGGGMSASAIIEEAVKTWIQSKTIANRLSTVATLALGYLEDVQTATPYVIAAAIGATPDEVHASLQQHNLKTRRSIAGAMESNWWWSETYAVNDEVAGTWDLVFRSCVDKKIDGDGDDEKED